ncbi:polysaccharide deacetylase family protein [Sporomusa sphaeroides]|jgi:peptidoglycan/xylan/chitin deacetylase (PgdA/CDA1 family)|uniref:polysaccharide deacetylase family protein n=1 Tax=Sporomusa sphaeroides TaxID=47679 RepID=UPI002B8E8EA6|nr:polysaccharide deacetylase family protein [Sporomusa sphaeroides]HML32354.1 polysaccharide deacetylase family protein [Sporomusa sphaeroides]
MIRILQSAAAVILLISVWLLAPGTGVPILAYHQVSSAAEIYSIDPADFEQQMQYLANHGYTAVSLSELFAAREGTGRLPEKPVIITFDDGYADNYLTALPIMEKYRMKSTVFIITGQVGQPEYLTWEQIRDMQARTTEIASHTHSHLALTQIDQAVAAQELRRSKQLLEEHLQQPVEFLAYPFGQYNRQTMAAVQQAGYRGACTGLPGLGTTAGDAYQLKRVNVPRPKYGLWEFRLRLLRAQLYAKLSRQ